MPLVGEPYLSLVVAMRNDDHGGNPLGRMQAFINGWIGQSRIHRIPSELIVVEWNPPPDRPRLAEVLSGRTDLGCCEVRFIEVPDELHRRFAHADALALYQMIAKNVGHPARARKVRSGHQYRHLVLQRTGRLYLPTGVCNPAACTASTATT